VNFNVAFLGFGCKNDNLVHSVMFWFILLCSGSFCWISVLLLNMKIHIRLSTLLGSLFNLHLDVKIVIHLQMFKLSMCFEEFELDIAGISTYLLFTCFSLNFVYNVFSSISLGCWTCSNSKYIVCTGVTQAVSGNRFFIYLLLSN
jgi:hypothetical protein